MSLQAATEAWMDHLDAFAAKFARTTTSSDDSSHRLERLQAEVESLRRECQALVERRSDVEQRALAQLQRNEALLGKVCGS